MTFGDSRKITSVACTGAFLLSLLSCVSAAGDERVFVTNEYFTFGSPDYFSVAVKLADFDLDGDLDALLVNGRHWARQDLVFFNNGDGQFDTGRPVGFAGPTRAVDIDVGDVNGDGFPDLIFANSGSMSRIYLNATEEQAASMLSR